MKTCYLYTLLSPPPEQFIDNRSVPPLLSIPVVLKDGRQWEIAILGTANEIRAVRVSIPETAGPTIDPEDYKRYLKLRLFALDCIRINYDSSIEYFRNGDNVLSIYNFLEPDIGPDVNLEIGRPLNPDFRVNNEGLRALLASPLEMRAVIHLLADGSDFRLPIQFRFLSLYKIIELHFKITTNKTFNEFIEPFLERFQELDRTITTLAQLCKVLNKLRSRCAHIKITQWRSRVLPSKS
jgi:hypothetical protein